MGFLCEFVDPNSVFSAVLPLPDNYNCGEEETEMEWAYALTRNGEFKT